MLKKILPAGISTAAIALGLGLATLAVSPASAWDGNSHRAPIVKPGITQGHHGMHHGSRPRGHYPNYQIRTCTPRLAAHKARSRGLRHVRISHGGGRFVIATGYTYRGGSLRMAFHRSSPHCSTAWVQPGHRFGYRHRY